MSKSFASELHAALYEQRHQMQAMEMTESGKHGKP